MTKPIRRCATVVIAALAILPALSILANSQAGVIQLLADSDSRYKIAGQRSLEITVKTGEQLLLRVTACRGKTWNRDGSIQGFTLLRAKRSDQGGWMEPALEARQAGVPSHRAHRAGRV
jgi:hypothetical protein